MQGQPRTQPAQMKRQATLIDSPTSCRSTVIDDSNESDSPRSCRSTVIDSSNESDAVAVDETLVAEDQNMPGSSEPDTQIGDVSDSSCPPTQNRVLVSVATQLHANRQRETHDSGFASAYMLHSRVEVGSQSDVIVVIDSQSSQKIL